VSSYIAVVGFAWKFWSLNCAITSNDRPACVRPSSLCFSGRLDVIQIDFDERAHLGWVPFCVLGPFRPDERQVPEFSRLSSFFEDCKSCKQDLPLSLPVSYLS
jgi:hypothetical protein